MFPQVDRGPSPQGMAAAIEGKPNTCHPQEREGAPMKGRAATMTALCCIVSIASDGTVFAQATKVQETSSTEAISLKGKTLPGLERFDSEMIAFMRRYQIPGASMAIVKNGRLVYARGFGSADLERKEPVLPTSLFRIASLSKAITAVAILRLIERGKLRRDDRVFDLLKLENTVPKGVELDPRWKQVTVSHLLRHEGGWDRSKSTDPGRDGLDILRFNHASPPLTSGQIIRYMLARPLDFDPGKQYVYSNFGYCLLGRVVEAVTGKAYEDYVRAEILEPLGIHDMRIGKTLLKDRAPREVCYIQQVEPAMLPSVFGPKLGEPVPAPYGAESIEAGDSYGGWIASSVDLARFATALDPRCSYRALSTRALEMMFRRPPGPSGHEPDGRLKDAYYAYGLSVRPREEDGPLTAWHFGTHWGSSSALLRRYDGVNAAILFNKRNAPGVTVLAQDFLDNHFHRLADGVSVWPRGSLFQEFTTIPDRKPQPSGRARSLQVR
jgi:N-acyl-D-amino-acid deacylase